MRRTKIAGALVAASLALTASAQGAFPGAEGVIAYEGGSPQLPNGNVDIFTLDPRTGAGVQLTTSAEQERYPSYSADGERIAFVRERAIWVMKADGTGGTQLTTSGPNSSDRLPAFAADGRIVFERSMTGPGTQIWIMNGDGSGQTQLTSGPGTGSNPAVSPDGSKIVYSQLVTTAFPGLTIMNADGSQKRELTPKDTTFGDGSADFTPDGTRVIFSRYDAGNSSLMVVGVNGGEPTTLISPVPSSTGEPAISPSGDRMAFVRADPTDSFSNLFVAGTTGLDLGVAPLTKNTTPNFRVGSASWQPLNAPACSLGPNLKAKSFAAITVTATCTNENASLLVKGKGKAQQPPKGAARKAKKFKIPAVSATLAPGVPAKVTLKIPKKGRKALKAAAKAGKKGKATITATVIDDLGQTAATDPVKVTFKAKKK